jgi:hypothetical protein
VAGRACEKIAQNVAQYYFFKPTYIHSFFLWKKIFCQVLSFLRHYPHYINNHPCFALAAWCSGRRLHRRNRRSWVRIPPGRYVFRTITCAFFWRTNFSINIF